MLTTYSNSTQLHLQGTYRVLKFHEQVDFFLAKDELRKIVALIFLNTRQKEASIEEDATLVTDSATRPSPLAWNLAGHDPSVLAALLTFLTVSDLLHLFDSKNDRLRWQTRRQ